MAIKKNYEGIAGVLTDGNLTVMLVPAAEIPDTSAISAALLNGETAIDITYDLTPDGFNHVPGVEEITSNRLTRPYETKREGKQTDTLTIQYAFNPDAGESVTQADTVITPKGKYYVISRTAVDHEQDFEAGDKVKVLPVEAGRKQDDPPAAGADFTRTVEMRPFARVIDETTLVAGA